MPDRPSRHRHGHPRAAAAPTRATMLAVFLVAAIIAPVAAADPSPSASPEASPTIGLAEATPTPTPTPTATPTPTTTPTPSLVVSMTQAAISYDAATNKAQVRVTVSASGAAAPWNYSVAVRGTTVRSGSSSAASVSVTVTNDCSITTQSVTAQVTDGLGRTAGTAATLNRSLCPPPPDYPHARDRILAGPTLTETSFVDRLRAVGSPALAEGRSIYRTLVAGGVNPAFALGTFHAESHSGTRGYAVTTKNWGNILFYSWEIEFGATPYAPGNGYTYAKYPTWLASVRAYVDLLQRYDRSGYTTVSSASARWLGTIEGSDRHLRYLNNITAVMRILPDDAVPSISSLSVPATSKAAVTFSYAARDNLAITGYQVRYRRGTTGTYSAIQSTTLRTHTFTLTTGTWTIAVRASDAAGNWSGWRTGRVTVDAIAPTMTSLRSSMTVVRSVDSRFTASWAGTDNIGITRYQWRTRRRPDGSPSVGTTTSLRSGTFRFGAGTWELDVRARDAVGNWSAWRSVIVIVPRDDKLFSFSAGTARRTHAAAYRLSLTTTNVAGAKLEVTTSDGDGFFLVGRVGPTYGRLRVTVDGTSWIVDTAFYKGTRATTYHDRVLIFSTRFAPGSHTVTIENLATTGRPTIAIDGLDFSR